MVSPADAHRERVLVEPGAAADGQVLASWYCRRKTRMYCL